MVFDDVYGEECTRHYQTYHNIFCREYSSSVISRQHAAYNRTKSRETNHRIYEQRETDIFDRRSASGTPPNPHRCTTNRIKNNSFYKKRYGYRFGRVALSLFRIRRPKRNCRQFFIGIFIFRWFSITVRRNGWEKRKTSASPARHGSFSERNARVEIVPAWHRSHDIRRLLLRYTTFLQRRRISYISFQIVPSLDVTGQTSINYFLAVSERSNS